MSEDEATPVELDIFMLELDCARIEPEKVRRRREIRPRSQEEASGGS